MCKNTSINFQKESKLLHHFSKAFWWVVGNLTRIPQSIALILTIHSSGNFVYPSFCCCCYNSTSMLLCSFGSLKMNFPIVFPNGRHWLWEMGEKKNSCAPSFGFWMHLQQYQGQVQFLLRLCVSSTDKQKVAVTLEAQSSWVLQQSWQQNFIKGSGFGGSNISECLYVSLL